jgi:hypothetical protein
MKKDRLAILEAKIKKDDKRPKVMVTKDLSILPNDDLVVMYEVDNRISLEHQKDIRVIEILEEFENEY